MVVLSLNEARKRLYERIGLIKMIIWEKVLAYIYKSWNKMFINFLLNKLSINFETLLILISLDIYLLIYSKKPCLRFIF